MRKGLRLIFWIYLTLVLVFVIMKFEGSVTQLIEMRDTNIGYAQTGFIRINLVPFESILLFMRYIPEPWALMNLFGNVIPFMPVGFLLPLAYPHFAKRWKYLACGFVIIFLFEVFQFETYLGSFDVDDIILNVFGIWMGYEVCVKFKKGKPL